jgi:hypothetical protein
VTKGSSSALEKVPCFLNIHVFITCEYLLVTVAKRKGTIYIDTRVYSLLNVFGYLFNKELRVPTHVLFIN